ncbi:hypothetical protein NXX23_17450 [Bacteroides ovatus]|nr:hypothetical protein [Bacteroides ovatus]
MVTREMAEAVIRNGRGDFDILAFIPERLWDAQLAYLYLAQLYLRPVLHGQQDRRRHENGAYPRICPR